MKEKEMTREEIIEYIERSMSSLDSEIEEGYGFKYGWLRSTLETVLEQLKKK